MMTDSGSYDVAYRWDTTDPANPGWYVEVRDGELVIDDSEKVGFPVEVDRYQDGQELAEALKAAYPDANVVSHLKDGQRLPGGWPEQADNRNDNRNEREN
jgi:hypothetical protein